MIQFLGRVTHDVGSFCHWIYQALDCSLTDSWLELGLTIMFVLLFCQSDLDKGKKLKRHSNNKVVIYTLRVAKIYNTFVEAVSKFC